MIAVHYSDDVDLEKLFEQEAADTKHKTGFFCGTGCEWYTKRDGSGQRVIKVRHIVKRTAPKKMVMLYGGKVVEVGNDTVLKNELFPFTVEGLKAAFEFRKTHNVF